jgi:hypothetical protein
MVDEWTDGVSRVLSGGRDALPRVRSDRYRLRVAGCGLRVGAMRQRVPTTIRRGRSLVVSKPLGIYSADTQERYPYRARRGAHPYRSELATRYL